MDWAKTTSRRDENHLSFVIGGGGGGGGLILEILRYLLLINTKLDIRDTAITVAMRMRRRMVMMAMLLLLLLLMMMHYSDVIMGAMASQITSLTIVYPNVYSGADERKHQSSASLAALLQLQLHSRLNTWLQWFGQRQLTDETRII